MQTKLVEVSDCSEHMEHGRCSVVHISVLGV